MKNAPSVKVIRKTLHWFVFFFIYQPMEEFNLTFKHQEGFLYLGSHLYLSTLVYMFYIYNLLNGTYWQLKLLWAILSSQTCHPYNQIHHSRYWQTKLKVLCTLIRLVFWPSKGNLNMWIIYFLCDLGVCVGQDILWHSKWDYENLLISLAN